MGGADGGLPFLAAGAAEAPAAWGTCAHCGEPVDVAAAASAPAYCCAGCAAAAAWIRDQGLGDYYRWRSAPAPRVAPDADFAGWDRDDVLDEHAPCEGGVRRTTLAVNGMHCAACAWLLDKALRREAGVVDVRANAVEGRVWLAWQPDEARLSTLLAAIARLGYRPSLPACAERDAARRQARRRRLFGLGIAGLGALQAMMFSEALYLDTSGSMPVATRDAFRWITAALSAPVVFYAGAPFLRGMVNEWRLRVAGMDTLIASGILLAWFGSLVETLRGGPQVWFDAAVMFVLFLLAARHLEAALRESGTSRLDALAGAQPALAFRERDGRLEQVPTRELAIGDVVRVAAGDPLPCDGRLLDAEAEVDEALLTGESTPQRRRRGDLLLAGGLVHGATLRLEASAVGAATTVAQVARRVAALGAARGASEGRLERLAQTVVVATLALAAATAAGWWLVDPTRAFPVALAVLVATCPCALALAAPAAVARAQARLAELGLLVIGAEAVRRLAGVDVVAFDKTGTLTHGRPRLGAIQALADLAPTEAAERAARLEAGVPHPLARAFGVPMGPAATDVRQHPGQGVSGHIDGRAWRLGRRTFALADGASGDEDDDALWLSREGRAIARFVVEDAPREDAAGAVGALRDRGFGLRLLSGDAATRALALAETVGIHHDEVAGRLSPQDKLAALRALQAAGRRVLMVGDGINDADVLAAADVSIAMGEGAGLAQRQADLVLAGNRLAALPEALAIANEAQAVTRQNLRWAIVYNLAILPAAALGFIGPGLAALGMALSSLAVTANAWRIGRRPSPKAGDPSRPPGGVAP